MQADVQAGRDPFQGKQAAPAAAPNSPAPGPTIQPVPEFAVVGSDIPPGYVPVDLTRGEPRPAAAAPPAELIPPTNPSSRWVPASQGNAAPSAPVAVPAAAAPPPGAQPVDTTAHSLRVLQGKYNTETRELRNQVNELLAQNRAFMAALSARPAAPAAAPAPAAPRTPRERAIAAGFTEKEIDEFGEDLVNMVTRTAENIAGPQIAELRRQNAQLAGQVQNTVQSVTRSAADRFWDDLADAVPEWAEINASQEWLDWLTQRDVISGGTRNDGLQKAFAAHDARWAAGIFEAFKAEDARTRPTAGQRHVDPATLVAPGQPAAGTPAPAGSDADNKIWTEEEVRQFYSAVRRGHIKGDQKTREEARINKALVEGRIRPDHNDSHLINSR